MQHSASPTCSPLGLGVSREAVCASPALAPTTGSCQRQGTALGGAAAQTPSSHISTWFWGPWQELLLLERVRGERAVGRLIGGVRLLSAVSEAGGSRVPLPSQRGLIPLARHRWLGVLPSDQIKPSKHKATSCMLEGAFLDPRSQHLYFHVPCWVGRGCFQSSWDGAFGQLDFLGSNLPPAAGGARGPGLLEVSGGMGLQGVGEPKELACILLQCAYGNTGDGAWGPGHVPRLQLGPG